MRAATEITNATKRVLVIEQNADRLLRRIRSMQAHGWQAIGIADVSDAPPQWPTHLYDLVVIGSHGDPAPALAFCASLKKQNPAVVVAMLANCRLSIPPTFAPDVVITERNEKSAALKLQALMKSLQETTRSAA